MYSLHMDSQSWKMQMYMFWLILHTCLCVDITYYIQEGKRPGTYVGDIAADSHLMDSISSQNPGLISFSKLQQGEAGNSNSSTYLGALENCTLPRHWTLSPCANVRRNALRWLMLLFDKQNLL